MEYFLIFLPLTLLTIARILREIIPDIVIAIITYTLPKDRLSAFYHIKALNKGIVTIPQPHGEVKQIPKTKIVSESSLHK